MIAATIAPRRYWWLAAGFVVWCVALVVLYALHAIGCAFAWPAGALRWSLIVVLAAHLMVVGWMWLRFARAAADPATGQAGNFLHEAIVWTLVAAFASTVLVLGPPLLLTTCL